MCTSMSVCTVAPPKAGKALADDESIVIRDESIDVAYTVDAGGVLLRIAGEPGVSGSSVEVGRTIFNSPLLLYRTPDIYALDYNVKWDIASSFGRRPH